MVNLKLNTNIVISISSVFLHPFFGEEFLLFLQFRFPIFYKIVFLECGLTSSTLLMLLAYTQESMSSNSTRIGFSLLFNASSTSLER